MSQPRLYWIDLTKSIAIFAVVLVHAVYMTAPPFYHFDPQYKLSWLSAMLFYSIGRIGVPLFFMVSGYLMIKKEESIIHFYSKRIQKLFIPLIVWSLIYALFTHYFIQKKITFSLSTPFFYHLWFLYVILFLYLITPLLIAIRKTTSGKRIFSILTIIWFILFLLFPYLIKLLGFTKVISYPYGTYYAGFAGYFILGYLLGELRITSKKQLIFTLSVLLLSTTLTLYLTYHATLHIGTFDSFFSSYYSLSVFTATIAAFFMLKYRTFKPYLQKQVTMVASLSFGIYLIHPIFLALLKRWFSFSSIPENAYLILPVTLATFILSTITVYLMQRINILKLIVP